MPRARRRRKGADSRRVRARAHNGPHPCVPPLRRFRAPRIASATQPICPYCTGSNGPIGLARSPKRVARLARYVLAVEGGFLAGLSADERAGFEALGRRRSYASGQVLFSEGDEGRDVVVLLSGSVKIVSTAPSGREVILEVFDAGELVGELSAIDGQPRSATAVALTPVDILVIQTPEFLSFLEEHGSAATGLLRTVVARLRHSSQRQLEFGTSD